MPLYYNEQNVQKLTWKVLWQMEMKLRKRVEENLFPCKETD